MANLLCVIGSLLAVCMIPAIVGESGASPPPSSAVDCSETTIEMMDCLPYVMEGSNLASSDKNCCAAIIKVVKVNPDCLCANLKQAKSMDLQINMTRAFGLPHECNIPMPNIAECDVVSLPSPSLASSTSTPSSESPTTSTATTTTTAAVPPAMQTPSGSAVMMKQPMAVVAILVTLLVVIMSCSYII